VSISDQTLQQAEAIIGRVFADRSLLAVALTHASFADSRLRSNERMEFLGDAVLGMLVCDHLYERYPDLLEGEMTKIKSAVVSRRLCAKITTRLGLDRLVAIGKGMQTRAALPSSLSAAVFEAVIGAIYLDAGLDSVRTWVMPLLEPHIEQAAKSGHQQNFKSVLQQHAQQTCEASAEYVLLDEKGPDHAKCFEVCAEIGGERFPSCWAPSKKQAEQLAALAALEQLNLVHRDASGHLVCAPEELEVNGHEAAADVADETLV
jgi:ribonuclease-3